MTKNSNQDYDNEVRASGIIKFDKNNGEIQIQLTDEFCTCQAIFDDEKTKSYFVKLLSWLFAQENYRSLDVSDCEILKAIDISKIDKAS